jgi:hypothetical protein
MELLTKQQSQTDLLIDNLIEHRLFETLKKVKETLINYTVVLYPTEENKAMIVKIDKALKN